MSAPTLATLLDDLIWRGILQETTPGLPARRITGADVLADVGRVVVAGSGLLAATGLPADVGVDAFDVVPGGAGPDLRRSSIVLSPDAFKEVVHGGGLKPNGMPDFAELTDSELADVRQYIRSRAAAAFARKVVSGIGREPFRRLVGLCSCGSWLKTTTALPSTSTAA